MEKPAEAVEIELSEPVSLTFSLKYLVNFCKASSLSPTVKISLSNEVPLLVEYPLAGSSYLRFYLAPKVCHAAKITPLLRMRLTKLSCRLATRSESSRRITDQNVDMKLTHLSVPGNGYTFQLGMSKRKGNEWQRGYRTRTLGCGGNTIMIWNDLAMW